MKTPSGTFAFVALAVIAIVTILSCRAQLLSAKHKFTLEIRGPTNDDFVDLQSPGGKDAFDAALRALDKSQYEIRFKRDDGAIIEDYQPPRHASIKTDKITRSELAKNASAGESAANDPNVTYRVRSNDPKDIKAVLDTFKEPSPTPTP